MTKATTKSLFEIVFPNGCDDWEVLFKDGTEPHPSGGFYRRGYYVVDVGSMIGAFKTEELAREYGARLAAETKRLYGLAA